MMKYEDIISNNSKDYFRIIKRISPNLLEYGSVVSKDQENPYIDEPGTLIIKISPKNNHPVKMVYAEPRINDVLIAFIDIFHWHYSWDYEEEKYKEIRMINSINFINEFISDKKVLVLRKRFLRKPYYEVIESTGIITKRNIIEVYKWE
jgi:hypothetical protein